MNYDKINKILKVVIGISFISTCLCGYWSFNTVCNNSTEYEAVQEVKSSAVYKMCGANFGITNIGQESIVVEELDETSGQVAQTKTLEVNKTMKINKAENISYQISNEAGKNLENKIVLNRF